MTSFLLTAAEMRAIEQHAMEGGAVTGLELMERAGRGVVGALLAWRPDLAHAPRRAQLFCGPGNNGGDGFVVARLLGQRGWEVEVYLYGDEARLPPDAAANARRWREQGDILPAHAFGKEAGANRTPPALRVDALFGTGLTRPFEHRLSGLVREIGRSKPEDCINLAVDAPSGLCMDSGRVLSEPIEADLTVTFSQPKLGHYLDAGPAHCGELRVVDIGLPIAEGAAARLLGHAAAGCSKADHPAAHKYDHGHVLVLSGGVGTGGAARLAARGALRIGAGAVTVGAPPAAIIENAAQLNAIMLRPVADLSAFLEKPRAEKMNAICLGPGMGGGERTRGAVAAACRSGRRVVLDADALTSFEGAPDGLFELLHEGCVLTPHMGEFGRIFPDLRDRLVDRPESGPAYSKADAARDAAARCGAVVLVKGADTVIACPDGRVAVNSSAYDRAAPWLATAGAGDVLAGFVAGLLARGHDPWGAAGTAAWLHVEAARKFGPGLIAEDLPEILPALFRDLGL